MAFEELKERQSTMWANGPYQNVTETLTDIHELVIEKLALEPGDRFLDLATGTGAIAERAARTGADVTGLDLSPGLIETAQERAEAQGLDIDYVVGDAENLEFEGGSFDKVASTCGIMFAPDHEAAARELARITAPGGRVVLANWTPGPGVGDLFTIMGPYQPAPPPSIPFDWGKQDRLNELLGDAFDLEIEEHVSPMETDSGESYWELFAKSYGPTKSLAEAIGERREELRRDWVTFFDENHSENGRVVHPRPYLLVVGTRR